MKKTAKKFVIWKFYAFLCNMLAFGCPEQTEYEQRKLGYIVGAVSVVAGLATMFYMAI